MRGSNSQILEHGIVVQLDVLVSHGCCGSRGEEDRRWSERATTGREVFAESGGRRCARGRPVYLLFVATPLFTEYSEVVESG